MLISSSVHLKPKANATKRFIEKTAANAVLRQKKHVQRGRQYQRLNQFWSFWVVKNITLAAKPSDELANLNGLRKKLATAVTAESQKSQVHSKSSLGSYYWCLIVGAHLSGIAEVGISTKGFEQVLQESPNCMKKYFKKSVCFQSEKSGSTRNK